MRIRTLAVVVSMAGALVGGTALAGTALAGTAPAGTAPAGTAPATPALAAGRAGARAALPQKAAGAAQPVKKLLRAKPVKKAAPAKPVRKVVTARPVRPAKATPFHLTGTLIAVDATASTVTVQVKGRKGAPGASVTVAVSAIARIRLDDAASALAALPVGAHVAVAGTVSGDVRTANRINAEDPTTDATPVPTTPDPTPTTPEVTPAPETTPTA